MKRWALVILMVGMLVWAGSAMACNPGDDGCPTATWTVTDDPTNFLMSAYGPVTSYSYTFDITTVGFDYNYDTATGASLRVWLSDNGDFWGESAFITFEDDWWHSAYDTNFTISGANYTLSGLYHLNADGTLTVTITAWTGDFYFDRWTLTVTGEDCPTPSESVPEPATMLLLGFGLAGVAYGRKKFRK